MQVGSARKQAMDAARRATMLKTTFASIRHLLDGNEFVHDEHEMTFPSVKGTLEEDGNPFAFIDQQFTKHELSSFKESGSEDDSINDFNDPFQTDEFFTSFPAFNPQSSAVTGDQSINDSKGVLSTDEDFGFDEVDFDSNFFNEAANNSNGSSTSPNVGPSKDRLSKRLNSSARSRRKLDKGHDGDNISATENTEISNGSSMKTATNSTGSGQRRASKSRNGEEIPQQQRASKDDAVLPSARASNRSRSAKAGNEMLLPRKGDSRPAKANPQSDSSKSRKGGEQTARSNPGPMDLLKALAVELSQKSDGIDVMDAAVLTDRVVTRVKELQASRSSKESVGRRCRSRSRGRLDKFDKQLSDAKIRSCSKEKRSRSRSRSRARLKALSPLPVVRSKSKDDLKSVGKVSKLDETRSQRAKPRRSKSDLEASRSPPAALLDEIKTPKTKSKRSKGVIDIPRSPPAALLDEIKSPVTKSKRSRGVIDTPRSPPAALLDEIKSPKRSSLKSKSKSKESRSANSSDDEIIEVLAKLINQQLSGKD